MQNQSTIAELWEFLRTRKRYWLTPIVLVLILLSALIVFTEGSSVAPFIYALFWPYPGRQRKGCLQGVRLMSLLVENRECIEIGPGRALGRDQR